MLSKEEVVAHREVGLFGRPLHQSTAYETRKFARHLAEHLITSWKL